MNCEKATEWIQRYVDNDLEQQEERELLAHTQNCHECAELLQRMKLLAFELDQLPKVNPRYSLVDAILPKLAELNENVNKREESAALVVDHVAAKKPSIPWTKRLSSYISWKLVGGVAVAGCAAIMLLWNEQTVQDPKLNQAASEVTDMLDTNANNTPVAQATVTPAGGQQEQASVAAPPNANESTVSPNPPQQEQQAGAAIPDTGSPPKSEESPTAKPSPTPEEKNVKVSTIDNNKGTSQPKSTAKQQDADSKRMSSIDPVSPSPGSNNADPSKKDDSNDVNLYSNKEVQGSANSSAVAPRDLNILKFNSLITPTINNDIRIANRMYVAEIKDRKVSISMLTTGETVFASMRLWSELETVSPIGWVSENIFQYEVAQGNAIHIFSIDVNNKKEQQLN
ncbi:zf-HC2 domain-containing protein [Paenibacillus sp. N1-5-1-14]|uniref:zf-HC2 domain-containing protein n=1 Tax=Paenibacillus radicibacter TaxID=2972488 RepID=UPI002158C950|nr:zf-HC2 domain-containing protein [Paenibacillus radicibacter]MCR8645722.1 zf-HC2 domain-containing protein [Paenibacillus radicibacter]